MEYIVFYWLLTLIICWYNFYFILKGKINPICDTISADEYINSFVNYFIASGSLIGFMIFYAYFHV